MQTRKLVGEMGILVHNEPVPVLQIMTVLIMEYQIKKVFFHMCCLSTVIEMKKPIHVTIGYLDIWVHISEHTPELYRGSHFPIAMLK